MQLIIKLIIDMMILILLLRSTFPCCAPFAQPVTPTNNAYMRPWTSHTQKEMMKGDFGEISMF